MRRVFRVTCAIAMLAAAGCGGSDSKSDAPIGAVDPSRPAPTGEATAEQVAEEMRGNVKCPASASTPRPEGAPIDDVVGVRPGMGWNEAATFVLCDNPLMVVAENTGRNYQINTYGQKLRQGFDGTFAKPRKVMSSRDYLRVGQARRTEANQPIGTAYAFDTSIAHLSVLYNGQQVRTEREYSVSFQDFALNAPGAATSAAPATGTNPGSIKDTADKISGIFGGGSRK